MTRDSSSSTDRSSPVMLSPFVALRVHSAKHLAAQRDRPFAALRVTLGDCSNCQELFFTIEPCLSYNCFVNGPYVIFKFIPHAIFFICNIATLLFVVKSVQAISR